MTTLRPPQPTSEATTKTMKANKGKNTGPEIKVRRMLRGIGYPGYRLNWKKSPGRPDIAYPGHRLAIFVNGCFWHRCPICDMPLPKSHVEYWEEKFRRNVERDARNLKDLEESGWTVVVIWECRLKKEPQAVSDELAEVLGRLYGNRRLERLRNGRGRRLPAGRRRKGRRRRGPTSRCVAFFPADFA